MHFVGRAELAAAVSNAGGLGILTALTQKTPDGLRAEIARCRTMTAKPFGGELTLLPAVTPPDYLGFIRAVIDEKVEIVETAGNNTTCTLCQELIDRIMAEAEDIIRGRLLSLLG